MIKSGFGIDRLLALCLLPIFATLFVAFIDFDQDNLPDDWETQYGFSTNAYAYSNLQGWWSLNQTNGAVAPDRSTNNLPLNLKGGASWITNGLFNQAIRLDGKGDSLSDTIDSTGNPIYSLTNFTFSAWVRTTNNLDQSLIRHFDSDSFGWQLGARADGRPIRPV